MQIGSLYITWVEYLLAFTAIMALCQLFYYVYFFSRLAFHSEKKAINAKLPPVSVVICARSESANLTENLPHIFNQDYPDFEVVVVNDRSWDDTKDILKAFAVLHKNIHVIHIEENEHNRHSGKKMALTLGIKGAKHELLVLTDADCRPAGNQWLRQIVTAYHEHTSLVLGYSPFEKSKGFLNKLIRYDAFFIAIQYLSFAKAGIPYMGVGRNLSYTKSLFFNNKGFKSHYHIASGDDDLFVSRAAIPKQTNITIHPDAHVFTTPRKTFQEWFIQKKRHFTTAPHYTFKHKFLLALYPVSLCLMALASIVLLIINKYVWIILAIWLFRYLLQMFTFSRSTRWLGQKDLLPLIPVFEWMMLFLQPFIWYSNYADAKSKWN
jgi:glycosyltransferase involved in cell wall biosynthesis